MASTRLPYSYRRRERNNNPLARRSSRLQTLRKKPPSSLISRTSEKSPKSKSEIDKEIVKNVMNNVSNRNSLVEKKSYIFKRKEILKNAKVTVRKSSQRSQKNRTQVIVPKNWTNRSKFDENSAPRKIVKNETKKKKISTSLIIPCVQSDVVVLDKTLRSFLSNSKHFPDEIVIVMSPLLANSHTSTWFETRTTADRMEKLLQLTQKKKICCTIVYRQDGPAFAGDNRNVGVRVARGQFLIINDADDEIHPNKIKIAQHLLSHDSKLDAVVSLAQPVEQKWQHYPADMSTQRLLSIDDTVQNGFLPENHSQFGFIHCGNIIVHRRVFNSNIWYHDFQQYSQDRTFLQKVLEKKRNIRILQMFLNKYDRRSNINGKDRSIDFNWVLDPAVKVRARTKSTWMDHQRRHEKNRSRLSSLGKIYWINLDKCHKRRQRMNFRFGKMGISHMQERWPGVDAISNDKWKKMISSPLPKENSIGRPLKPGEFGITLSFLTLFRHLQQKKLSPFTLILEDDAVFSDVHQWKWNMQNLIDKAPDDSEILLFGWSTMHDSIRSNAEKHSPRTWLPYEKGVHGAFAAAFSSTCIQKLATKFYDKKTKTFKFNTPDIMSDFLLLNSCRTHYLNTPLIHYECLDSEIHSENLDQHHKHLSWMKRMASKK